MTPAEESLRSLFDLHEELGRGGMGVVYRATQRALDREVALKVLAADLTEDETLTRRFIDEARLAAAVVDPCLVRVLDVDTVDGRIAYIAYELVRGKDLQSLLEKQGPLARDLARGVALDLLGALAALHAHGILHRDVKPSNLLVGSDARTKLTDLGIARDLEDSRRRTRAGTVMGTPGFVSPEQIRGQQLTPAVDVYAAGAVMYALTTGQVPYPGTAAMEIVQAQLAGDPVDPAAIRPDADPVLAQLALRALERDPRKRITVAELRTALAPYDRRSMGLVVPPELLLRSRGGKRPDPGSVATRRVDQRQRAQPLDASSSRRRPSAQAAGAPPPAVSRTGAVRQVRSLLMALGLTGVVLIGVALLIAWRPRGGPVRDTVRPGPDGSPAPSAPGPSLAPAVAGPRAR